MRKKTLYIVDEDCDSTVPGLSRVDKYTITSPLEEISVSFALVKTKNWPQPDSYRKNLSPEEINFPVEGRLIHRPNDKYPF